MDQTPRPDESRDDDQDHQRDLDAEFAARDEQTLADYAANPYGFTAGMKVQVR